MALAGMFVDLCNEMLTGAICMKLLNVNSSTAQNIHNSTCTSEQKNMIHRHDAYGSSAQEDEVEFFFCFTRQCLTLSEAGYWLTKTSTGS